MVAGRRDGAGRAGVEAARAADAARARVRAQLGLEPDVARLLELADERRRLQEGGRHARRVARIRPQIAVALAVRGEQWRAACQVEHEVGLEQRRLRGRAQEAQTAARGGCGRGEAQDLGTERPEVAAKPAHGAAQQREGPGRWRHGVGAGQGQDRDGEAVGEPPCRLQRGLGRAVDEAAALRLQREGRGRLGRDRGFRQEGGDLGLGRRALVRPAGALADVGEQQARPQLGRDLGEERRLLRAGDQQRLARGQRLPEAVELRPAELGRDLRLGAAQRAGDRAPVEAHRALAVAQQAASLADDHPMLPTLPGPRSRELAPAVAWGTDREQAPRRPTGAAARRRLTGPARGRRRRCGRPCRGGPGSSRPKSRVATWPGADNWYLRSGA